MSNSTSTPSPDRSARIDQLAARLQQQLAGRIHTLAEHLVDAQDSGQLFGDVELHLRDTVHDIATDAHQTLMNDQKKTTIKAVPSSAPTVPTTPTSPDTALETS